MADVVQFPDQSPQPDAEFTYTDEHGVRWGKYLCEYQFDGARWSVELWARSFEDAQARIGSVGCTGVVKGLIYTQVDASNVTMEGLARAGAEIAQPEERQATALLLAREDFAARAKHGIRWLGARYTEEMP